MGSTLAPHHIQLVPCYTVFSALAPPISWVCHWLMMVPLFSSVPGSPSAVTVITPLLFLLWHVNISFPKKRFISDRFFMSQQRRPHLSSACLMREEFTSTAVSESQNKSCCVGYFSPVIQLTSFYCILYMKNVVSCWFVICVFIHIIP